MNIYDVIFLTLFASLIISIAQLMFKKSIKGVIGIKGLFGLAKNRGVIIGVILYFIGLIFYIKALSNGELSLVYPIFASSFIFVTIISSIALKEKINLYRIIGVLLIFLGIVIVAVA